MRIFAWEYVTGGGARAIGAGSSLIVEGRMMIGALARDLAAVPGIEIVLARDPEIELGDVPAITVTVSPTDPWEDWRRLAARCDAVWPIVPETDGLLEEVTRLAMRAESPVLNSRLDALAVARSKRATARRLADNGIPVLPCARLGGRVPAAAHGWVVKPNDGAGSSDTHRVTDRHALDGWADRYRGRDFILQAFLPGDALSLSMLAQDGAAWLLSCNRQHMTQEGGAFAYRGGTVGGAEARRAALAPLAKRIAAALPGLWGYVGIDLVDGPEGPVVLEINPRLTTSYVGLADSIGENPAALVLALIDTPLAALRRELAPRAIEIAVPRA